METIETKMGQIMGCEVTKYEGHGVRIYRFVGPRGGVKTVTMLNGKSVAGISDKYGCPTSLKGNYTWTDEGGTLRPKYY